MTSFKRTNKFNFDYIYNYYLDKGLSNKEIAKKINISIRSLYYYKKGEITEVKTKNIKTIIIKKRNIKRYKKIKKAKKKIKHAPPPPPPPIRKIKETQYIFKAICKFDSPPFNSEHFFTWIGTPGLSEKIALKFGLLHHTFWKHHKLENLQLWERKNVYED